MIKWIIKKLGGIDSVEYKKIKNKYKEDSAIKELRKIKNSDIRDLIRGEYNLVTGTTKYFNDMTMDERKEFLDDINRLHKSNALNSLITWIKQDQLVFTTCQAKDYESVILGRGTINGLLLLTEQIKNYNQMFEDSKNNEKEFNKFDLI